jgi:hypothetical protein
MSLRLQAAFAGGDELDRGVTRRWSLFHPADREILSNIAACAGAALADPLMSLVGGSSVVAGRLYVVLQMTWISLGPAPLPQCWHACMAASRQQRRRAQVQPHTGSGCDEAPHRPTCRSVARAAARYSRPASQPTSYAAPAAPAAPATPHAPLQRHAPRAPPQVDTAFVGRLGLLQLAALGPNAALFNVLFFLGFTALGVVGCQGCLRRAPPALPVPPALLAPGAPPLSL